jgi:hypothetical protein
MHYPPVDISQINHDPAEHPRKRQSPGMRCSFMLLTVPGTASDPATAHCSLTCANRPAASRLTRDSVQHDEATQLLISGIRRKATVQVKLKKCRSLVPAPVATVKLQTRPKVNKGRCTRKFLKLPVGLAEIPMPESLKKCPSSIC